MAIEDQTFFEIPQTLNKPKNFGGFTFDEVIPAFSLFVMMLLANHGLIGMALVLVWIVGIRKIKNGRSTKYLLTRLCWYFPKSLNSMIYKDSIPSVSRFFLA